jgi:hypothetical protein
MHVHEAGRDQKVSGIEDAFGSGEQGWRLRTHGDEGVTLDPQARTCQHAVGQDRAAAAEDLDVGPSRGHGEEGCPAQRAGRNCSE